mmetsp:Transcript_7429/g.19085  ORF Transcript_7429/g.19085 Transcript_7429/m.19085 type:complete len:210 (-) Transcript_7429:421-1050(-)
MNSPTSIRVGRSSTSATQHTRASAIIPCPSGGTLRVTGSESGRTPSRTAFSISCGRRYLLSSLQGTQRVASSHNTIPNEYVSIVARNMRRRCREITSGAIHASVPTTSSYPAYVVCACRDSCKLRRNTGLTWIEPERPYVLLLAGSIKDAIFPRREFRLPNHPRRCSIADSSTDPRRSLSIWRSAAVPKSASLSCQSSAINILADLTSR